MRNLATSNGSVVEGRPSTSDPTTAARPRRVIRLDRHIVQAEWAERLKGRS